MASPSGDEATRGSTENALADLQQRLRILEGSSDGPAGQPGKTNGVGSSKNASIPIGPALTQPEEQVRHRATVRSAIEQNAAFTVPFVVMNTLATVVACYGLLGNSTAVVIGAMIIALLLGPISGIALALVDGNMDLLRKALLAEIGGAVSVLAVSFTIGLIHKNIPLTHELLSRTTPNIIDLMIALAGGAAGAYATVSPRLSVGLVGVAIATALVPPLSTCGICLARHEPALAWGGFLLFLTNLVAIQFASSVVMWLNGYHAATGSSADGQRKRSTLVLTNGASLAALLFLTAVMGANFVRSLNEQTFQIAVREQLTKGLAAFPGVHLADVTFRHVNESESVIAVIRSPYSFSPNRVKALESALPKINGKAPDLEVMSVLVKETTRDGYVNEPALKMGISSSDKTGLSGLEKTGDSAAEKTEPTTTTDTTLFGH